MCGAIRSWSCSCRLCGCARHRRQHDNSCVSLTHAAPLPKQDASADGNSALDRDEAVSAASSEEDERHSLVSRLLSFANALPSMEPSAGLYTDTALDSDAVLQLYSEGRSSDDSEVASSSRSTQQSSFASSTPWWVYAFGESEVDEARRTSERQSGENAAAPLSVEDESATTERCRTSDGTELSEHDNVSASVEALARRLSAVIAASAAARAAEMEAWQSSAAQSLRQRRAARIIVRAAHTCPFIRTFHARRNDAAVILQAHARGFLARRAATRSAAAAKARAGADLRAKVLGQLTAVEQVKRRQAAAVMIQRHTRALLARLKLCGLRTEARHRARTQSCATHIQRVIRGHLVRSRLARAMQAVAALEAALGPEHQDVDVAPMPYRVDAIVDTEFPEVDVNALWAAPAAARSSDGYFVPSRPSDDSRLSDDSGHAAEADEDGSEQYQALSRQEVLERSKAQWGFTSDAVAAAYLAAASRHRTFINRKATHERLERDPQARLDHVLKKQQRTDGASPVRQSHQQGGLHIPTASSAARAAAVVGGSERTQAAGMKSVARNGSPVHNVTLSI